MGWVELAIRAQKISQDKEKGVVMKVSIEISAVIHGFWSDNYRTFQINEEFSTLPHDTMSKGGIPTCHLLYSGHQIFVDRNKEIGTIMVRLFFRDLVYMRNAGQGPGVVDKTILIGKFKGRKITILEDKVTASHTKDELRQLTNFFQQEIPQQPT